MSYEAGLLRYILKTPFTSITGFISMYIFGGTVMNIETVLEALQQPNVVKAIVFVFLSEVLPPTSIEEILIQVLAGSIVAGLLWYVSEGGRGGSL